MSKNRGKSKLSKNVLFNANKHVFHCEKSLETFFYGQPSYKGMILPVVLYECETWYLILQKEQGLKVFENRLLRIFGQMRDKSVGGWIFDGNSVYTPLCVALRL
jgi:hypothetical protein